MSNYHLLIIDDDEAIYDYVAHILNKSNLPIKTSWASTTEAANACISEQAVDMLFLDQTIGAACGLDWYKKNHDKLMNAHGVALPVIVLTSSSDQNVAIQALQLNVSDFLPKQKLSKESVTRIVENTIEKYQLQCSVKQQYHLIEARNTELTQKNEEITGFYQTISHELKTPLASITQFADILLDNIQGELTNEQRESLQVIQRNCKQISLYINDLLEISQIKNGRFEICKNYEDLNQIIQEAVMSFENAARLNAITLTPLLANDLPKVFVDGKRIYQVLLNLTANAFKFTPKNGQITLGSNYIPEDALIRLTVEDTGCGIAEDLQEKIFEPLYQIKSDQHYDKKGLGLGLAICREIISQHQGRIYVNRSHEQGTCFHIDLKISESDPIDAKTTH